MQSRRSFFGRAILGAAGILAGLVLPTPNKPSPKKQFEGIIVGWYAPKFIDADKIWIETDCKGRPTSIRIFEGGGWRKLSMYG